MKAYKIVQYEKEAREALRKGAEKLSKAVVSTLGPLSNNVIIESFPVPVVVHDGVTVANNFFLKDRFENLGASLIRDAARRTNDLAGDGTTTATLLANTLFQEAFKITGTGLIDGVITKTLNSMETKQKLLEYVDIILDKLDKKTQKIKKEDAEKIANISAADPLIGKIVAEAIKIVGADGVIMVERGNGFETELNIDEGAEFENGFLSPYFVTDPDHMIADYGDAYVLLTDQLIFDGMKLVNIITKISEEANPKPLLIIADDVQGPALNALVKTKMKINIPLVAVKAPEYADRRKEMLEDLAVLTGGNVISSELGMKLEDVEIKDLGRLKSFRVSSTHTALTPSNIDQEEIQERINAIKKQIKEASGFKKDRLEYRLGKLQQKVATITVGGASDSQISDKRERIIDAINATKAAILEGTIAGGGVPLLEIAQELEREFPKDADTKDQLILDVVVRALSAPFETIINNAGQKVEDAQKALGELDKDIVVRTYDVVSKQAGDAFVLGLIDPVKVTKLAIKHSFAVATDLITVSTSIANPLEDDKDENA